MEKEQYRFLIQAAFREDLGAGGDITSAAIFYEAEGEFTLLSKDTGILAGMEVFHDVFHELDDTIVVEGFYRDGDLLKPGNIVALVKGRILSVLSAERIALNFLSSLSGIATKTKEFVQAAAAGGKAVILDTRKTLPGYRYLSKYAVRQGGGRNHRMGLYDMVMIKDNHIDAAGSIIEAVNLVRQQWQDKYKIEVECRSLEDVEEALACRVDVIMLDNMDTGLVSRVVSLVKGKIKLEASGNMNPQRVKEMSSTGVDYISAGAVTKSVAAFDFSLKYGVKV